MALNGSVAIIAGGLGGLGTATGLVLHSQGAQLPLLYEVLQATYGADRKGISTYECDITSKPQLQGLSRR